MRREQRLVSVPRPATPDVLLRVYTYPDERNILRYSARAQLRHTKRSARALPGSDTCVVRCELQASTRHLLRGVRSRQKSTPYH